MRRLSELSAEELARLLNLTTAEAKRYLEQSSSPEEAAEKAAHWLGLSIEEAKERLGDGANTPPPFRFLNEPVERVERLHLDGRLYELPDYFEGFHGPPDAGVRFRQLQHLLRKQFEFAARFPEAYEILFPRHMRRENPVGLLLPSFGVRVLHSDPQPRGHPQGSVSGGDAYSYTHDRHLGENNLRVERGVWPVYQGDLRGVLLAILSREEFFERVEGPLGSWDEELLAGASAPRMSPIRLTDLRLATVLKPGTLTEGLKTALGLLPRPFTAEHVALWKLQMLGSELDGMSIDSWKAAEYLGKMPEEEVPEEARGYLRQATNDPVALEGVKDPVRAKVELLKRFGDEAAGTAAVSFTAAALWLFLDLDMPGVQDTTSYRLAEQVEALANSVRKLLRNLDQATVELGKLTANRPAGRQPDIEGVDYHALRYYRIGKSLRAIAEWLGMTPYSSKTGKGTREWKARTKQRLLKGKEFEERYYPRAAAIFAHRDNPHVRRKARRAYRAYLVEVGRYGHAFALAGVSGKIRTGNNAQTERSVEITDAYVQLGSCIMRGISPVP